MIGYRIATIADGPALNAMARTSFVETFAAEYEPDDFADYLSTAYGPGGLLRDLADPEIGFHVACDNDGIVGYAKLSALTLQIAAAEPGAMELRQLYVLRAHHGAGIAARLMEWALERARLKRAPAIYLAVFEFNHRARAFYARYGFEDVGKYPFRIGRRIDMDRIWRLAL